MAGVTNRVGNLGETDYYSLVSIDLLASKIPEPGFGLVGRIKPCPYGSDTLGKRIFRLLTGFAIRSSAILIEYSRITFVDRGQYQILIFLPPGFSFRPPLSE